MPDYLQPLMDPELEALRLPPHSIEAEQSVLGGLLLDNAAWDRIDSMLGPEDFYRFDHRLIFQHISRLIAASRPADVITVFDALSGVGKAEEVGGLPYLNALAQNTPSAANIRHYAQIVRDRSVLRKLITAADEISGWAISPHGREVRRILDDAEAKIFSIGEDGSRGNQGAVSIRALTTEVYQLVIDLYDRENKGDVTGLSTGFIALDKMTSGFQKGDLIIVAGRPSMGKTAFSVNIAEHVAVANGLPVVIYSMEMSGSQLAIRMIGSIGRLDQQKLRTGQLDDEDWGRFTYALERMDSAQLFVDESPALTVDAIRSSARRLARQSGGLELVIVDYLQLMSTNSSGENRATEVGEMSRGLKALAKELGCPVIAISQLNRSVESRLNKRPMMSDLRDSGSIEQDADLILFIYRDEVYNPDSPQKGTAEIIIAKQRNGPTGMIPLTFNGALTRFDNHIDDIDQYRTYGH